MGAEALHSASLTATVAERQQRHSHPFESDANAINDNISTDTDAGKSTRHQKGHGQRGQMQYRFTSALSIAWVLSSLLIMALGVLGSIVYSERSVRKDFTRSFIF